MPSPLRLLYPPKCPFCQGLLKKGETLICDDCLAHLPRTSQAGGRTKGRFFSLCVSPLYYRGRAREALLRFKFGGRFASAPAFACLMADRVNLDLGDRYDLITWVPVSFLRLRRRGYSQTRLLAEELEKLLDREACRCLRKRRYRPPQSRKEGEAARIANVSGAFASVHPERFTGKRVLLIDDVVTTGATLAECARVLLTDGAAEVVCATLCCKPHST